jgi:hypothetical protein
VPLIPAAKADAMDKGLLSRGPDRLVISALLLAVMNRISPEED